MIPRAQDVRNLKNTLYPHRGSIVLLPRDATYLESLSSASFTYAPELGVLRIAEYWSHSKGLPSDAVVATGLFPEMIPEFEPVL